MTTRTELQAAEKLIRETRRAARQEAKEARPEREAITGKLTGEPGLATPRRAISAYRRGLILERQKRCCARCASPFHADVLSEDYGGEIVGPFQIDHVLPLELGGADAEANYEALCYPCHKAKTREDVKRIAKAKRQANLLQPREPSKRPLKSRGFEPSRPSVKMRGE